MAFRAENLDTWAGSDSGSIMDCQDKQEWVTTKAAEIVTGWYQVARSPVLEDGSGQPRKMFELDGV